ncbi:hypothetical protein K3759_01175 [Sulfitobacter sp. W027]|uniref:hypothetical protein n=1 Tax=Sulfitobacter sp. W027 TaxID=2867025 RepID=UPI0021A7D81C|nr:hypothetical protein [Sulfitobacter sp. W027]UWR33738.1 hypothetical protein K3759_01175 [Sulfitobacter sp. W027]
MSADDCPNPLGWCESRWRWEFLRRSPKVRSAFSLALCKRYQSKKMEIPNGYMALEENLELVLAISPQEAARVGYAALPNPVNPDSFNLLDHQTLSFHEARRITLWDLELVAAGANEALDVFSVNQLPIIFDPSAPIAPQLEGLAEYLLSFRHPSVRDDPRKQRGDLWFSYLRILDAREAGYTYAQCAERLCGGTTASDQTARDRVRAAQRLQDRM